MGPFRFLRRGFPADLAEVDVVCRELRELLLDTVPDRDRFALELLAREALCNAVRHGSGQDRSLRVQFEFRLGRRRAVLKVADQGPGFDWRAVLALPPDDDASHGRGLALYRLYADKMLFNALGNRILLIRTLPEPTMTESKDSIDGKQALLHPGDLTSATVEPVRAKLKTLLGAGVTELTVDLAGVQMVDSMGIGLLIQAHNSLAKVGGTLTVRNASAELLDLFRSMRLDKRFTLQV